MTNTEDIITGILGTITIIAMMIVTLAVLALVAIYIMIPFLIIYYGLTQEHIVMILVGLIIGYIMLR